MQRPCSPLWLFPHTGITSRIERSIASFPGPGEKKSPGRVFFRADDVAAPCKRFARLIDLFIRYRIPLSLGVVPSWLTKPRWGYVKGITRREPALWCWHQHGWRHINHEKRGKKQEFGASRDSSRIRNDLILGRERLESLMGKEFYPVFTPPWNRCDAVTLKMLKELRYHAISRFQDGNPQMNGLPEFSVNVDLHTRSETDPMKSMDNLFNQLEYSMSQGLCGIMIHHQRMNDAAFGFLEVLVRTLLRKKAFSMVSLRDLITTHGPAGEPVD